MVPIVFTFTSLRRVYLYPILYGKDEEGITRSVPDNGTLFPSLSNGRMDLREGGKADVIDRDLVLTRLLFDVNYDRKWVFLDVNDSPQFISVFPEFSSMLLPSSLLSVTLAPE